MDNYSVRINGFKDKKQAIAFIKWFTDLGQTDYYNEIDWGYFEDEDIDIVSVDTNHEYMMEEDYKKEISFYIK